VHPKEFESEKALADYAERNGLVSLLEPTFAKWRRLLSPERYCIVEVRTSRGIRPAMLLPKAILKAAWTADPLRQALMVKRGKKAEKVRQHKGRVRCFRSLSTAPDDLARASFPTHMGRVSSWPNALADREVLSWLCLQTRFRQILEGARIVDRLVAKLLQRFSGERRAPA
jgi:hypothetical protein